MRAFRSNERGGLQGGKEGGPAHGRLYSPVVNGAIGRCRLRHCGSSVHTSPGGSRWQCKNAHGHSGSWVGTPLRGS
jgi:hypothetical protein